MNKLLLASLLFAGISLGPVLAQPAPFDMSPESELVVPAPTPPPAAPAAPATIVAPAAPYQRHLLPSGTVRLEGEQSREAVVVYLTQAEVDAQATLHLAYVNALVVAPEYSQLAVTINGTGLTMTPIASSAGPAELAMSVPPGMLRRGANIIEFTASQRHRTDCSVQSTYELWTELPSTGAWLSFAGEGLGAIRQLSDLGAVGAAEDGLTTLRVLTAGIADPAFRSVLLRVVQQAAIALRVPYLQIELVDTLSSEPADGVLDLVVMPAANLGAELATSSSQAAAAPTAVMVPMPSRVNTLLLSGPDWASIARAGDALLAAAPASPERPRADLADPYPLMPGGQSIELAELGVETVEFNGRRFATTFQFELPADFYAYRYGTLDLILDAAFSADVEPGSEIDIFTNGQIASATPLLRTDGGLLRDTVIRIPMTNLRPGRNVVDISVSLVTQSDAVCSAGWTGRAPTRFVFSNSTQLRLPEYARAAALPDLLVLTGSGWPYAETGAPLALGTDPASLQAAMLFLSRIATAAGRVVPVDVIDQSQLSLEDDALVIMPYGAISAQISGRTGLAGPLASSPAATNRQALDQFSGDQPAAETWAAPAEWLAQRVGLELTDLRVRPLTDEPYSIPARATVVSQVHQPEGGLWTVLTAIDGPTMLEGTSDMVQTDRWRQVAGRVSSVVPDAPEVTSVAAGNAVIVSTQPFSISNFRLVAANWFSGNALYFTGAIIILGTILMFSTSFVLGQVGRRE